MVLRLQQVLDEVCGPAPGGWREGVLPVSSAAQEPFSSGASAAAAACAAP